MKKDNRIIIFTDDICEYVEKYKSDIVSNLKDNDFTDEEINDDLIFEEAQRLINWDCEDLREALNHTAQKLGRVLLLANLGFWNGRARGGEILSDLSEILRGCEDINTLYYTRKNGTLKMSATHHDGTHYIEFYEITDKGEDFIQRHEYMEREALHKALRKNGRTRNIHFEIVL